MARSGKSSVPLKYKKEEWQHLFERNKKTLLLLFQCDTVKNNSTECSNSFTNLENLIYKDMS